jgi:hypothetical protein
MSIVRQNPFVLLSSDVLYSCYKQFALVKQVAGHLSICPIRIGAIAFPSYTGETDLQEYRGGTDQITSTLLHSAPLAKLYDDGDHAVRVVGDDNDCSGLDDHGDQAIDDTMIDYDDILEGFDEEPYLYRTTKFLLVCNMHSTSQRISGEEKSEQKKGTVSIILSVHAII